MANSGEVPRRGQIVRDSSTARRINNLLNSSKTRLEGLQLLNLFLPRCPDEDFLNFCIIWMQSCCKVDGLANNRNCAARLLRHLLKTSSNYPELKKSVSFFVTTRYFDFFFKYFSKSDAGWACTEACLLLYRGACGPYQEGLEKYLKKEIERDAIISPSIGRCFALLPCIGGGGNEGVNYKKNWRNQFVKFLNVCHSILNDFLGDVEEIEENGTPAPEHNNNKHERSIEHLASLLHNYCKVLGFMLLNQYPAPKNIPSDLVFRFICRGLALNSKAARKLPTADAASLEKVLPLIHHSLISLLKAVIVTCKNQLLPYSRLVGKLIKQCLQWPESDINCGQEKSFACLRTTTYETLCDWLAVARSGSCVELISDVIVTNAVNDIRPKKGGVFLKEAKLQDQWKDKERTTRQIDACADGKLCRAALRALQFLLKFSGVLLKPELHKFLQEVVVKLLVEIQKSPAPDVAAPFADPACRSELYSLLLELVHQPCLNWPPPTNIALRLFGRGVHDVSPQVSSFCSAALNLATIIIHPQYDNGGFPLRDPRDGKTRPEEEPPTVNEEALSLLSPVEDETVQGETAEGNTENFKESNEADASDKPNDPNEMSEISSDENSRNTVLFSKDFDEVKAKKPLVADEGRVRESGRRKGEDVAEDVSDVKRRRTSTEVPEREKTPSPAGESPASENWPPITSEAAESGKMKKLTERSLSGPESISPESTNEDSHRKARYFLRSKTKGSSEEPEETSRGTSSPESSKGTPAKSLTKTTPSVQSLKKRPRTRALSKVEGNTETEGKATEKNIHDDEEDITAAFDDSFVD